MVTAMEKNVRLVNIYVKIHNKHALTVDDLAFLAKWDPECFAKTCHNLVYNVPQAGRLMQPEAPAVKQKEPAREQEAPAVPRLPALTERAKIENFLINLKKLELNDLKVQDVSAQSVKNLMGNLYMELMFPHNDREACFYVQDPEQESVFNERA